jgi:uncharacterized protein (TIGR02588 family)
LKEIQVAGANPKRGETPALEWIAAGIGLLLVLALFAVIGREALSGDAEQLPAIEVAILRVAPAGSGFVVAFEARNRTGGTAAAVEFEGQLKDGETLVETSGAVVDYVPGHGRTKGGMFFSEDPRRHRLEVRALGFQTP